MDTPPALHLDNVLDDPSLVRELLVKAGPYWSVQRYFANPAEHKAVTGGRTPEDKVPVVPWFRGDWAYDGPLVEGVEPILANPRLAEAAATVFGGGIVRPQIVYVNLNFPMPRLDPGHTDVAAFRGFDRKRWPIWLLIAMARSGLFEAWRIRIATAVVFFYEGEGGELCYWPEGPDGPRKLCPARTNTALVGDNDRMYHRVEAVGDGTTPMIEGLSLDARLAWAADRGRWQIFEDGRLMAEEAPERVRVSVSWKAQVFRDEEELRLYEEGEDQLTADRVVEILGDTLGREGWPQGSPEEIIASPAFVTGVGAAWNRTPTSKAA
jgi:hypothetical protein